MTDIEILDRWKPVLNYVGENCTAVPEYEQLDCAFILNNFEIKSNNLLKKDAGNFLRRLIPIIRRSFTKSHNNRLDNCVFDIQKNHISNEYILVLYDGQSLEKTTYPVSLINVWVMDEDLSDYLSKLPFKNSL